MNQEQPLELLDIYDVWYHPWWSQTWFLVLASVIIVSLVLFLGYWIYKRFIFKEIVLSPHEIAQKKLVLLQSLGMNDPKQFYISLTTLIKEYLGAEYGLPFGGTTDDEMLGLLESSKRVPNKKVSSIKEILDGVVLIKFANQQAAQQQMQNALKLAFVVITSDMK